MVQAAARGVDVFVETDEDGNEYYGLSQGKNYRVMQAFLKEAQKAFKEFTLDSSQVYQKGFETQLQELMTMTNTKSGGKVDEKMDQVKMLALETLDKTIVRNDQVDNNVVVADNLSDQMKKYNKSTAAVKHKYCCENCKSCIVQ